MVGQKKNLLPETFLVYSTAKKWVMSRVDLNA